MFAKWPIVAERASPGNNGTAGMTRPLTAQLPQFGLPPPTFSGDALPSRFWLTVRSTPTGGWKWPRLHFVRQSSKGRSRDDDLHRHRTSPDTDLAL